MGIKDNRKWAIHLKYKVQIQQDQRIMDKVQKFMKNMNSYSKIDKNLMTIFIIE